MNDTELLQDLQPVIQQLSKQRGPVQRHLHRAHSWRLEERVCAPGTFKRESRFDARFYYELLRIYRSPELLLDISKPKRKADPDPIGLVADRICHISGQR